MLNDDFDGSQRHVSARNLVRGTCPPFIWRHRLQKVFDGREKFNGIEVALTQVLRDISGELPHTFQHEFCDPSLFRFR
jgi:hypothetical protein